MSVKIGNTENIIRTAAKRGTRVVSNYAEGGKLRHDKEVKKAMLELQPKVLQMISKVNIGEIQNIIITAVGTGLIAPIFIKYNPLSKADNDTKTYTAFRQPVSALIAVVTQAGIVDRFNKLISNKTNSGRVTNGELDKSCFQDESYIKSVIKKSYPNLSNSALNEKVMEMQEKQLETMMNSARKKGTIEYISNGKTVTLPEEYFRGLLKETADGMHKNIEKNIERYTNEKVEKQISRGLYLRNNSDEATKLLNEINTNVQQLENKELKKYFEPKIKELKKNKANEELITMVEDIYRRSTKEVILDKISDNISKVEKFVNCSSEEELKTIITNKINAEKKALLLEKTNIEKLQKGIGKNYSVAALEKFSKKFAPDLLYDTVMKHNKNIGENIKGFKQVTGLIVSLAILPISCAILNAVYPKIMDALFPELSKTKHSKEKDKFIKGCDPKQQAQTSKEVQK